MEKLKICFVSSNHPLLYLRNDDDIFAVFENNESCLMFLDAIKFIQ